MNFVWNDYISEYVEKIEDFLDKEAIKYTSCEDGFNDFYTYWYNELGESNFWCKVILIENELIAVIALAKAPDNVFTIQEFIVSPNHRGKGYGSAILKELLNCSNHIIGQDVSIAEAVIYPDNIASQKAFQKAGFVYTSAHPDGDAWYYQYKKRVFKMMKKEYKTYKKFKTPSEVEAWVKENYKEEELEKVSVLPNNPNKMALNLYKGSGYKRINTLLWRGKSNEIVEEITKLIEGYVIPQNIVVTRFVDIKEWWALLKGTVQGKAYEYKGFLSTTMLKKYFGMDNIKWGRLSIQIYIPKGAHGVYLPEVNCNAKEFEILISPGQKLKRISCNKYAIII